MTCCGTEEAKRVVIPGNDRTLYRWAPRIVPLLWVRRGRRTGSSCGNSLSFSVKLTKHGQPGEAERRTKTNHFRTTVYVLVIIFPLLEDTTSLQSVRPTQGSLRITSLVQPDSCQILAWAVEPDPGAQGLQLRSFKRSQL